MLVSGGLLAGQGAARAAPSDQRQSTAGVTKADAKKGEPLMPNGLLRLRFERSGGPIHLTISGSVSFHNDHAEVAADAPGGKRELGAGELGVFRALDLEALGKSEFAAAQARAAPGQPDRYQYDVTLETSGGREIALRFGEQPPQTLNSAAHGLGDLAEWVRREVGDIWRKKAEQK
jgi:hypothetical protein